MSGSTDKRHNLHYQALSRKKTVDLVPHCLENFPHRYVLNLYPGSTRSRFVFGARNQWLTKRSIQAHVYLKAKAGVITSSEISFSARHDEIVDEIERFHAVLKDKSIQEIHQFKDVLGAIDIPRSREAVTALSGWLDTMFGK